MKRVTLQDYKHQVGKTCAQLLGQWLPRNGRELAAAPCFEVYLNDPETTPAADLLTDVHAPLNTRLTHR